MEFRKQKLRLWKGGIRGGRFSEGAWVGGTRGLEFRCYMECNTALQHLHYVLIGAIKFNKLILQNVLKILDHGSHICSTISCDETNLL